MADPELIAWRFAFLSSLGLLTACGASSSSATPREESLPAQEQPTSEKPEPTSEKPEPTSENPEPNVPPAVPTVTQPAVECEPSGEAAPLGHERCTNGVVHRTAAVTCPNTLGERSMPEGMTGDAGVDGACRLDSDCTDGAYGHCVLGVGQLPVKVCNYGCVSDADCGAGELCACGENIGECIPADCMTDADCESGICALHKDSGECVDGFGGPKQYACLSAADECRVDADCSVEELSADDIANDELGKVVEARCAMVGGARKCQAAYLCGIGRPFLVSGHARLAQLEKRNDWCSSDVPASLEPRLLPPARRDIVARHWQKIALMEHASVAAFARFQLQLLSFGAPAALVEATNTALADETRHARQCFTMASRYGAELVGPGPLHLEGALESNALRDVVLNTVLEGCIGETVAAAEASWAASRACEADTRALLAGIAKDEQQHAELAWKFLQWASVGDPELLRAAVAVAESEWSRARAELSRTQPTDDTWLTDHGLVPERQKHQLKVSVLEQVVLPCLQALCNASHERAA